MIYFDDMSRNVAIAPGEYYHIYNRGTDKRNIFLTKGDYARLLSLLYLANDAAPVDIKLQAPTLGDALSLPRTDTLVDLCAYVLMPNHFHLLIREKSEGGISKFMQKVSTGYTMYFNKRVERTGALFQGRYKASHVSKDEYLKYLISYIHLNPIKLLEPSWKENGIQDAKGAEAYLEQYSYSSFLDFMGRTRVENSILEPSALPDYFDSVFDFKTCVREWLNYKAI